MNSLAKRICAFTLSILMFLSLCSCGNAISSDELRTQRDSYLRNIDKLYTRLISSGSDTVSESDYTDVLAEINNVFSDADLQGLKASERAAYSDKLKSTYISACVSMLNEPIRESLASYEEFYLSITGDMEDIASASDTVLEQMYSCAEIDDVKTLAASMRDVYFDAIKADIAPENIGKLHIKAYRPADSPDCLMLCANFRFPRIRESNMAFSLEFVSSNGLEFSEPDTLYNSDAIEYILPNVVKIDMNSVITSGEYAKLFTAYKRITFVLFAIDNSYTFAADLSAMRSDDIIELPPKSQDYLCELLSEL